MKKLMGLMVTVAVIGAGGVFCGGQDEEPQKPSSPVKQIESTRELETVVESAGQQLVVIDLYADWCMPCQVLSPMLARLALEKRNKASFYKIDVDRNPSLARRFMAQGIPHVVFVRGGKVVHSLSGLQSPETYAQAIDRYAG